MSDHHQTRLRAYEAKLGKVERTFPDDEAPPTFTRDDGATVNLPPVHVYAFGRNFAMKGDQPDNAFVLVTSGMSDQPMSLDEDAEARFAEGDLKRRAELIWYVRDPTPAHIAHLRWLAQYPFMDATWLGWGHTVPLPDPIFPKSQLTTSLLLGPIVKIEQSMLADVRIDGDAIDPFVVHLLTPDEYQLKRESGVNALLDLFDEGDYGLILDEERTSLIRRKH